MRDPKIVKIWLARYLVMVDNEVLAITVWPKAEFIKAPRKLNMDPEV